MDFASTIITITKIIIIYIFSSTLIASVLVGLELIFQWNSRHLKASIKNLFNQERQTKKDDIFVRQLYNHPLIKSLNQRTGRINRMISSVGPDYIPSNVFAKSLLAILKVDEPDIEKGFSRFIELDITIPIGNVFSEARARLRDEDFFEAELFYFKHSIEKIVLDFESEKLTILEALKFILRCLDDLIIMATDLNINDEPMLNSIVNRLRYLKESVPTSSDILSRQIQTPLPVFVKSKFKESDYIPPNLYESIVYLVAARKLKYSDINTQIEDLSNQVEDWFERAMKSAEKTYKFKWLMAILLSSFLFVLTFNLNTFDLANTFEKRQLIQESRQQIAEAAITGAKDCTTESFADEITDKCLKQLDQKFEALFTEPNISDKEYFSLETSKKEPFVNLAGWLVSVLIVTTMAEYIVSGGLNTIIGIIAKK